MPCSPLAWISTQKPEPKNQPCGNLLRTHINSAGDYDVTIPAGTVPGQYRIRVGRFADDSLYGCSGRFHVVRDDDELSGYDDGGRKPVADDEPKDNEDPDDWALSMGFSYTFHDGDEGGRGGGGSGGDGGMDDDEWWIATDDEDDKPGRGPGRGGGGLWGDDDDEQEEDVEERPKKGLDTDDFSFSYEFVWTTDEWYN